MRALACASSRSRSSSPADVHEAELGIARGADVRAGFFGDALDVAQRKQTAQAVFVVDDEQFVDAEVFVEKLVGGGDGIFAEFLFLERVDLGAWGHGFGNFFGAVAFLDDTAR